MLYSYYGEKLHAYHFCEFKGWAIYLIDTIFAEYNKLCCSWEHCEQK